MYEIGTRKNVLVCYIVFLYYYTEIINRKKKNIILLCPDLTCTPVTCTHVSVPPGAAETHGQVAGLRTDEGAVEAWVAPVQTRGQQGVAEPRAVRNAVLSHKNTINGIVVPNYNNPTSSFTNKVHKVMNIVFYKHLSVRTLYGRSVG